MSFISITAASSWLSLCVSYRTSPLPWDDYWVKKAARAIFTRETKGLWVLYAYQWRKDFLPLQMYIWINQRLLRWDLDFWNLSCVSKMLSLPTFLKSYFCPKSEFWLNFMGQRIWIFAPKLESKNWNSLIFLAKTPGTQNPYPTILYLTSAEKQQCNGH